MGFSEGDIPQQTKIVVAALLSTCAFIYFWKKDLDIELNDIDTYVGGGSRDAYVFNIWFIILIIFKVLVALGFLVIGFYVIMGVLVGKMMAFLEVPVDAYANMGIGFIFTDVFRLPVIIIGFLSGFIAVYVAYILVKTYVTEEDYKKQNVLRGKAIVIYIVSSLTFASLIGLAYYFLVFSKT